ncbi:MAG: tRNA (N6-isopentenyl adenosine(37)-C2)-methylthiotransferase MiaB [Bacteriovoracaceae bacterium]|nr:tRNA (N6-isopentenyl adenosine(37)-C2)-methylthiotransferase MiaB [Bacteriovoracaceae bacterium]
MSSDGVKKVGNLSFPPRKVWVKTFGCQMNYHDTQRLFSHLQKLNFTQTSNKEEANLILFNTCAVRDLANLKFYSQLGEVKHLKKGVKDKNVVVGVGGCVSQIEGEELLKKYAHLNFAFGTDAIDQISDILYRIYSGEDKVFINSWDTQDNYSIETKITHGSPQAFVNIIKGCNNFCSYCIVPYTRGREKSRRLKEVVEDVKGLVKNKGIQEVTLLGQNVNSFGKEHDESFCDLLKQLDQIEGLELIRYTTSHPYDLSDDLIAHHGSASKLSNHLHLPVQSGSNTVLKRMNRKYTADHYLNLVAKLKNANPEIVLSTDIIVGFPDESEQEYQQTIELLDKVQFDFIYSYKFSPRANTQASKMEDGLSDELRSKRLRSLQLHQLKIQEKNRKQLVGQQKRVLVEKFNVKNGEKKWMGRTNCNRIVHFLPETQETDYQWHWVELKITQATALSCQGTIVLDHGTTVVS